MSNLILIKDLESNRKLDNHETARIVGGRFFTSTADLHKWIYGDQSPYGRKSLMTPDFNVSKSQTQFSFFGV